MKLTEILSRLFDTFQFICMLIVCVVAIQWFTGNPTLTLTSKVDIKAGETIKIPLRDPKAKMKVEIKNDTEKIQ